MSHPWGGQLVQYQVVVLKVKVHEAMPPLLLLAGQHRPDRSRCSLRLLLLCCRRQTRGPPVHQHHRCLCSSWYQRSEPLLRCFVQHQLLGPGRVHLLGMC